MRGWNCATRRRKGKSGILNRLLRAFNATARPSVHWAALFAFRDVGQENGMERDLTLPSLPPTEQLGIRRDVEYSFVLSLSKDERILSKALYTPKGARYALEFQALPIIKREYQLCLS